MDIHEGCQIYKVLQNNILVSIYKHLQHNKPYIVFINSDKLLVEYIDSKISQPEMLFPQIHNSNHQTERKSL